jgi:murein L,D-transpeptidase YcbB/YkuD
VLAAPGNSCGASHLDRRALARFYPGSLPQSLWVDDTGPLPHARRLRAVLERSGDEGLPSTRYGLAAITARWEARTPIEQACLDVLLTTAFDRYGRDLATGIVAPSEADRTWHVPAPAAFDAVAALRAAKADPVARLEALAPKHGLYERLRAGLARYRRLADDSGWETALAGPLLRPGDESDEVRLLRERLRREGDLDAGAASLGRSYDATLTEAVRSFQRRHGLAQDGVVGPRTLAAFNTPVDTRIAQLRRGMERLRWLPHDLGSHYVFVNIAGFELAVVEDDRTVLTMRVIVGMADQSTPSFAATLRLLTINPYWTVPHRIARDRSCRGSGGVPATLPRTASASRTPGLDSGANRTPRSSRARYRCSGRNRDRKISWGGSPSRFPTPSTCSCMTHRLARCSPARSAHAARGACASSTPWHSRCTRCAGHRSGPRSESRRRSTRSGTAS